MADTPHEHVNENSNNSGMGFFLGMVVLAIALVLIFIYGLPYLRNAANNSGGAQINVPDQIDVNLNQSGDQ